MTEFIKERRRYFVQEKRHHVYRTFHPEEDLLANGFAEENLNDVERAVRRLQWMLDSEQPVVLPEDKIAMLRTVTAVPEIFTMQEHQNENKTKLNNITPMYSLLLDTGTLKKREELHRQKLRFESEKRAKEAAYIDSLLEVLAILEAFGERYRVAAEQAGNVQVAEMFAHIPKKKPRSFLEALQGLRFLHFCLWCSFNFHNTFGRFDQYMYPYLKKDIDAGLLDEAQALEIVEEFFISCNKDSDLYPGVQQGDNGQSIVLGGLNPDGTDSYNYLSSLCMQASLELKLIDPKINLRVNKHTPQELYIKGSELTRQGLGFPQYSNDDIIIKALKNWGYEEKDAYDYAVAACWEFIIPGLGMEVPNIDTLSFLSAVLDAFDEVDECDSFDELLIKVKEKIFAQTQKMMKRTENWYIEPSPLMSLLMHGCIEKGQDVSLGCKYNNYGFHGTGLSTAVDSLAAIQKYVYQENLFTGRELLEIVKNDFNEAEDTLALLRYHAPKMGNDDDVVDSLAVQLLDWFADSLAGHKNTRGGIFRAGTGSAMFYIWDAQSKPASPDGRRKGEALACNYSPSLFSRCEGPVSIIKSFTKPHLERVANGGPLTIELHDSMFRNEDSVRKVAMFVKSYIDMGGHQLQINAINREDLLDAQENPDNHRNLIVRVWGWSGYFVELDEVYQDHIIKRMELIM